MSETAKERKPGGLLREPLVHFAALGALLFGLYAWTGNVQADDARETIAIDAATLEDLHRKWTSVWGRSPSELELRRMAEDRVREEVLFREALAMNLDQDDIVLRRRMVQKMEFLFEDVANLAPPTDGELTAFLEAEMDRYREPERRAFTHAFFSPDVRENASQDARAALDELKARKPVGASELGDRFLRALDYELRTEHEVTQLFGEAFARALFALPLDQWSGPVGSRYGAHLVRVTDTETSREPTLDDVRDQLMRDIEARRLAEANDQAFAKLRERYRVDLDEAAFERLLGQSDEEPAQ